MKVTLSLGLITPYFVSSFFFLLPPNPSPASTLIKRQRVLAPPIKPFTSACILLRGGFKCTSHIAAAGTINASVVTQMRICIGDADEARACLRGCLCAETRASSEQSPGLEGKCTRLTCTGFKHRQTCLPHADIWESEIQIHCRLPGRLDKYFTRLVLLSVLWPRIIRSLH